MMTPSPPSKQKDSLETNINIDPGGGGDLLKPNGVITDTQAAMDIEQLISKYAFGEVKKDKGKVEEKEQKQVTEEKP